MKRLLFIAVCVVEFAGFSHAQTLPTCTNSIHCVQLNWNASADAALNPTLGYQVYRLNGTCPAIPPATISAATGFVLISGATPLTGLTYIDNGFPAAPLPPGAYCYFVVSALNAAQSVPSNLGPGVILPSTPVLVLPVVVK